MRFPRYCLIALFFVSSYASANEYPTTAIVRSVVSCMAYNGGQNEENLYACTCRFDALSSAITFDEYEMIAVYLRNKEMPGEKGGAFRDRGPSLKDLRDKYDEVEKNAVRACPIAKRVTRSTQKK